MRLACAMVAVVALTAPASSGWAGPGDTLMAPAEPPVATPWKIGQSVTYELTGGQQTETVTLRVVAEDTCGVWIEYATEDATHRACITRPPNPQLRVVVTRGKDGLVKVDEAPTKVGTLDALEARWDGRRGIPREDVTTPAGTFPAALKEVIDGQTRWSHPAVPLGGMVRANIGPVTMILVDYALTGGTSVISADQRAFAFRSAQDRTRSPVHRFWFSFSFGNDMLGTIDDAEWTESLGAAVGYKLTTSIALVVNTMNTGYAPYAAKPELWETLLQARAGVRYFPLAHSTGRYAALVRPVYLQLDVGYAQLERGMGLTDSSTVGRGGVGGVSVGITTGAPRDWRLALEAHQHTALLNADEGVRVTYGLHGIVELHFK